MSSNSSISCDSQHSGVVCLSRPGTPQISNETIWNSDGLKLNTMAFLESSIHRSLMVNWPCCLSDGTINKTPHTIHQSIGFLLYQLSIVWHSMVPEYCTIQKRCCEFVKSCTKGVYDRRQLGFPHFQQLLHFRS